VLLSALRIAARHFPAVNVHSALYAGGMNFPRLPRTSFCIGESAVRHHCDARSEWIHKQKGQKLRPLRPRPGTIHERGLRQEDAAPKSAVTPICLRVRFEREFL
jgi:hypothetical protein